jgi:hypothetical protein
MPTPNRSDGEPAGTPEEPALFEIAAGWQQPAAAPAKTPAGERRRARIVQAIAYGLHPLSLIPGIRPIRLHPEGAGRTATKENAADRPMRCGTCRFRVAVGGHSRDYPKCLHGAPLYRNGDVNANDAPRVTSGDQTDCLAWWPACTDYQAKD